MLLQYLNNVLSRVNYKVGYELFFSSVLNNSFELARLQKSLLPVTSIKT